MGNPYTKERNPMSRVSRESAPEVVDYGPAEDRTAHFHGYTVNFTSIKEDADLAPLLKGLPGDSCQCPHWGYVTAGRLTVRYADHQEVIEPGDAFYMPPGHVPAAEAGSEFVMFSPKAELEVSEAAIKANMQRLTQGS
jgi:quercetin dioxygenase-like cupin family protein